MNFKIKSIIFTVSMLLISGCGNTGNEAVRRFGAISIEVDSLGKEVADDIYQSCIRVFEIENDIDIKGKTNPDTEESVNGQRNSRQSERDDRDDIVPPTRRSSPVFSSSAEIPFPDRRSTPIDSRTTSPTTRRIGSSSFTFNPLRRMERCKNAELQSQITQSGFTTLSEYGKLVYFLVSGDAIGGSNFTNSAAVATNGGKVLTVDSQESETQAELSLSNFLGIEKVAQSLISLISNAWLAQVRSDELRPLVICRNDDVQTLISTLNNLSDVFYPVFVLRNEEALNKNSLEVSYQNLQRSLERGEVTQSIFDDSVQSLTSELDKAMQDFKERRDKVNRLAAILENLAFYHNQAANLLSSASTDREISSTCKEYDIAQLNFHTDESQTFVSPSTKLQGTAKQRSKLETQTSINQSNPLLAELTLEEKRVLASLLSDFVKSLD